MSERLNISKNGKILIVALLVLILGGSGGYLLWRTNQPDTVAPTDSEAGGGVGACCGPLGCVAGWKCEPTACSETISDKATCTKSQADAKSFAVCSQYKGASGTATEVCKTEGQKVSCKYNIAGTCVKDDNPKDPEEGTCDKTCEWPEVLMSDTCTCAKCGGQYSQICNGNPPTTCAPPACSSGSDAGTSVDWNGVLPGGYTRGGYCTVYHKDCNNPSRIYRYCKPASATNTCDSGEWLTKPTGSYEYCDPITYTAKAKDKNGIDKTSVVAKLNNVKRTSITFTNETATSVNFSESLSTTTSCLPVGTYTLDLKWKDKKGATSTACSLTTKFEIASSTNVCDGGKWLTQPTGSYQYCDPITYTAKAKDSDGIDKTSVVAKLNDVKRTAITFTNETTTTVDFSEPLSTTTNCLPVGTYTLDLSWKDKKGATSTNCALTTTFSILADEQNPNWTIAKTGVEQCLENGDAQVIYTIKIKNIGTGTGSIDKIVDALDSKVLASYITGTISEGGLFGSGSITWELEEAEETFVADQEKTYTYTLTIPKIAFGSYTNMVTATPTTGENFSDSVTVTVDCEQDIPQTGLFDSTVAKIIAGIVLLLLGFNLQRVDSGFRTVQNSLNKLSISIQDTQSERRKRNFEKKIVKK